METIVRIPTPLRTLTGGADEVSAAGRTVGEVIEDLERRHPGIRDRLLDEKGVRRFVNIYVGEEDVRFLDGLKTALKAGRPDQHRPGHRRGLSARIDRHDAAGAARGASATRGRRASRRRPSRCAGDGLAAEVAARYLAGAGVGRPARARRRARGGGARPSTRACASRWHRATRRRRADGRSPAFATRRRATWRAARSRRCARIRGRPRGPIVTRPARGAPASSRWSTRSATRRSCACGSVAVDVPDVEVWAKLEFANPGGSVKDRPALRMMHDALADGRLTRDKILIDSTSGNTGVAYSLFGAALGVRVRLVMPSNVSKARKDIARSFGTEIIYSDPMEGSDGAIRVARELVAKDPDTVLLPRPVLEPRRTRARTTTAPGARSSRRSATGSRTSSPGSGTTGTMMGTTRRLKEHHAAHRVRRRRARATRCTGSRG